jgi:hypothetical protein
VKKTAKKTPATKVVKKPVPKTAGKSQPRRKLKKRSEELGRRVEQKM